MGRPKVFSRSSVWQAVCGRRCLAPIAAVCCTLPIVGVADGPPAVPGDKTPTACAPIVSGPTAKFGDGWRTAVALPPHAWPKDDFPSGECRAWVEQGWLIVERRTDQNELEWKIVLAKVVDEEPPRIEVPEPGRLRFSYCDGRYFVRDEFGEFRCVRQPKPADEAWPAVTLAGRNRNPGGAAGHKIDVFNDKGWYFMAAGPQRGAVDCLVRLNHQDLITSGGLAGVSIGPAVQRGHSGELTLMDDGDLLVGKRLEEWAARRALARREIRAKLRGSPAPELAGTWLNTGGERLSWDDLKGNVVLLVFCDSSSAFNGVPVFNQHLPPLKQLYEKYYSKGLVILGVYTRKVKEAERFIEEHHIEFPVLSDPSDTADRFGIGEQPSFFLIDRQGKVVWGNLSALPATAEIEKLLGE